MKTIIKVSAIVLGLLVSYSSYCIDGVSTMVTGSKSFRVKLEDTASEISIRLKDQYGQTLYQERLSGPVSYDKVFNVSSLSNGHYELEMEFPTSHQIIPVEIKGNQVSLDQSQTDEYFKPIVRQRGDKVSVNLLNTKLGPLKILVFDGQTNQLLSEDTLKDELIMGKQFDFSKASPGSYLISMSCNGKQYAKTIVIEE